MISVGSGNVNGDEEGRRKGLMLGLGLSSSGSRRGREMNTGSSMMVMEADEEDASCVAAELEEGEASSYHRHHRYHHQSNSINNPNADNDDSVIDPDVALSYLDEKLHDVLGHFQKDFEGGVSAENLGAKFGGYGSFLPTYQRSSPSWSHDLRTPSEVLNYSGTPRSPKNPQLEVGKQDLIASSSTALTVRPGPNAASVNALRAPSASDSVKHNVNVPLSQVEESTAKRERDRKSTNPCDQKTLKVRIKVGAENLSTRKNEEIYSGLGLDVSPSSSIDDSLTDSEGLFHGLKDVPIESPTSILQIMTSVPADGRGMLSPLLNDLICIKESKKIPGKAGLKSMYKGTSSCESDLMSGKRKNAVEKKLNPSGKDAPVESINDKDGDDRGSAGPLEKKETDVDTVSCEELVSNALKLPLLSNSYRSVADHAKDTAKTVQGGVKNETLSDLEDKELLEHIPAPEENRVEKPKGKGSVTKAWENRDFSKPGDHLARAKKEVKVDKSEFSAKAESNSSKGRQVINAEICGSKELTSLDEDIVKLAPVKEKLSSGGKKKSKGSESRSSQSIEVSRDRGMTDAFVPGKSRKSSQTNNLMPNGLLEGSREDHVKTGDRYREFFGDLELEEEDNESMSPEMPTERPKESELSRKRTIVEHSSLPKDIISDKRTEKPSQFKESSRVAPDAPRVTGNGPNSDPNHLAVPPLVQEDWVCCDKCQTWRLLPLGTNPESLPEKWVCAMLYWLPGMNRCGISEEETTRALRALYHPASVPESHTQQDHSGKNLAGVSPLDGKCSGQDNKNIGPQAVSINGKKRYGSKEGPGAVKQDGLTQPSNSLKKNSQASAKIKTSNGGHSPLVGEHAYERKGQPNSSGIEKHKHKQKDKRKLAENYSDGGSKSSKIKNKRESDLDDSRASKKIKTQNDDILTSENGKSAPRAGRSSSSGLSNTASGKDTSRFKDCTKELKDGSKRNFDSNKSSETQIPIASDDASRSVGIYDNGNSSRKRKGIEDQNFKIQNMPHRGGGHHSQDNRNYVEETCENDHRKEKRARASKSDGKYTIGGKADKGAEKQGRGMRDQQAAQHPGSVLYQRSVDNSDALRRDLSTQPSAAATSSSSKVSGSHKKKALQEAKGSPVESVSSSPVRISNMDKITSTRNVTPKHDFPDAGLLVAATPRRSSEGEDDKRVDKPRIMKKEETNCIAQRGSLESSMLDFQEPGKIIGEVPSLDSMTQHATDISSDPLSQSNQSASKAETSGRCVERSDHQYRSNGHHSKKSGKGSSSRSKDKSRNFRSEVDKGKTNGSLENMSLHESHSKSGRNKLHRSSGTPSDTVEKSSIIVSNKDLAGKLTSHCVRGESHSELVGHDGSDGMSDVIRSQDKKQNSLPEHNDERLSKKLPAKGSAEVPGRVNSQALPSSTRGQNELTSMPGLQKETGTNLSSADAFEGVDSFKAPKQSKSETQNGNQSIHIRHITPNTHNSGEIAQSPIRKDSSSQAAANAVKEAKNLKHLADRLKNSGAADSTTMYFQAALKFLHGASLLETCNSESTKHNEIIQSMQMYSSTAKLCEFCAHEYEKSKDMAAAALAYKCMEVAYMRVVYSSHTVAIRDRNEVQSALHIIPSGESPSSSASDVDNLNNQATADKVASAKGVGSPPVAGNNVITAQNRSSFVRLLNYAQDVNFAMEASRKSRIAFTAANTRLGEPRCKEGISAVRKALDFNFQDVDGLLRLVRLAMDAISR